MTQSVSRETLLTICETNVSHLIFCDISEILEFSGFL